MDHEQIQAALAGPIASLRTPFTREGDLDYRALEAMVEFDIAAGSKALLITWGDSLYALLSDEEITAITAAVKKYAAGRAAVCACTGRWPTARAREFAAWCGTHGIDILQVFLPQWYPGCLDPDLVLEHFRALGAHVPLMANSAELLKDTGAAGMGLVRRLAASEVPVLAMKADLTGPPDRTLSSLVGSSWVVFAGGQKSFHLELLPYGCRGYLSTFITFAPDITRRYWQAVQHGDLKSAVEIIEQIDRPLFDYLLAQPGGFDAALHGVMELKGLSGRWRRAPFSSLDDAAMERLSGFLKSLPL